MTLRTYKFLTLLFAVLIGLLAAGISQGQNTQTPDNTQALIEKGTQAFNNHNFEQASMLFRQARKADNQTHKLSKSQREALDKQLDDAARGLTNYRIAEEALGLGKQAMDSGDYAGARKFYTRVNEAEKYVPASWVQEAKVQLGVIVEKEKKATPPAPVAPKAQAPKPAPVQKTPEKPPVAKPAVAKSPEIKVVTKEAGVETQKVTPVKPKAKVKKTRNIAKNRNVQASEAGGTRVVRVNGGSAGQPAQPTLLDQILADRNVQREQALASYREAERRVRGAVLDHQYLAARDTLRQARQDLLRSRRLFNQSEAEQLLLQIQSLGKFIDDEEQSFQQQQILLQMKETEQKKLDREQQVMLEKFNKIKELFSEAIELRREQKYDESIEKARQVLVIDPNNDRAKWFIEDLQDMAQFARQRQAKKEIHHEYQTSMVDAEETRISWVDEVKYPKNWEDMTKKRAELMRRTGKAIPGEGAALITEKKLKQTFLPDTIPFKTTLRKAFMEFKNRGVKVLVRWTVLETEGVTPDDEVKYTSLEGFKDISLKQILEIIVKTMGPEEANINYAIDTDGMVVVSTKDNLGTSGFKARVGVLETRVYDIYDLMFPIKRKTQEMQLQTPGQGGGGSSALGTGSQDEEQTNDEDENKGGKSKDLVELIASLVRPETWSPTMEKSMGQGEGTIDVWRRHWLIIFQSAEVHSEIEQFLAKMREAQAVQISLEARFISVSSNFLEKIGLDLDVVLNQGHAGYDFTGARNAFGDPNLAGIGPGIVQPRTFSYLGSLPTSPTGAAVVLPPGYAQPYGTMGLVPVGGGTGPQNSYMTPIPIVQGSNSLVSPQTTGVPGSLAGSSNAPAFQVMGAFLDDLQVNFLLEATQMDKYSSLAQSPRVVMSNGSKGIIQVESLQPYIQNVNQVVGSGAAGANTSSNYMAFGTRLSVMANTTDLRYVNMYIEPRVTSPDPSLNLTVSVPTVAGGGGTTSSTGGGAAVSTGGVGFTTYTMPGSRVQQVMTEVSVPDGGTVLIGGLKQSGEVTVEAGPPMLDKIPVLKRLFANNAKTKDNFTLLILVRPKILLREEGEPGTAAELMSKPAD
jgi:type II secretory pathway component GspD/PulD (secretin)